jgi:hypothetical protein
VTTLDKWHESSWIYTFSSIKWISVCPKNQIKKFNLSIKDRLIIEICIGGVAGDKWRGRREGDANFRGLINLISLDKEQTHTPPG